MRSFYEDEWDIAQKKFDKKRICRWCGAICTDSDFCPKCERKIIPDHSTGRRGEQDMVDGLKRNFGHKLSDWLNEDVREDSYTYKDVREYTFEREDSTNE